MRVGTVDGGTTAHELDTLKIQTHRLDNGLQVVLHPDSTVPITAINLWYHVGSRNDPPGRSGIAHLFEHMLFQGSRHVASNEHQRLIQQMGGTANGSTWYDRTNYFDIVPSQALETALWLEADRMGYLLSALSTEKLDLQRQVVLNERRQVLESRPYGGAYDRLHEMLFPVEHPYHRPVMGYEADIEGIRLEDIQKFFQTFYIPANTVLTVAGDLEPDRTLDWIERYFGHLPAAEAPRLVPPPIPQIPAQRVGIHQAVDLVRLYFGFRLPPYGDPHWYAADLLSMALAGGKSSLLYRELVLRRQWALDVSAFVLPTEWAATWTLVVVCRPEAVVEQVETLILETLAHLATELLPEPYLERCRNRILTQFFRDLQPLEKRADTLSKVTTYFEDPGLLQKEVELYRHLEPEAIRKVVAAYLDPRQASILTYLPQETQG